MAIQRIRIRQRLIDIAHGRSGDKGNHANIAVIAYTASGYDWMRCQLNGPNAESLGG